MRITLFIIAICTIVFVPSITSAHSGGTDSSGGHHCWTNCEQYGIQTGEYHYHDEMDNPLATYDNNGNIFDRVLAKRLHGQILLQVEDHGEAWYVRSNDDMRYYMKNGDVAYEMMRFFSLGITDADLATIPSVADTTEMNESTSVCSSNGLANRLSGEILLQVEQHGEAWYVDPDTCRTIYMEDGAAAYEIMRFLGLGIVNADLEKIPVGITEFSVSTDAIDKETTETTLTFNGSGADVTGTFELEKGLIIFTATHSGDSNFITKLLNSEGETVEFVTNEIGKYEGSSVGSIREVGTYLLNINADGAWTIEVNQPQPTDGDAMPISASGTSNEVIGPFYLTSGLHTFEMTHNGSSNFIVQVVNLNGDIVEFLANEIGSVTMTQAAGINVTGLYYLSIVGDTSWTVEVN